MDPGRVAFWRELRPVRLRQEETVPPNSNQEAQSLLRSERVIGLALLGLLIVSVAVNIATWVRISGLEADIAAARGDVTSRFSTLEHRIGALSAAIDRPREPAWVSRFDVNLEPVSEAGEFVEVRFDWALLELDSGASVTLVYLEAGRPETTEEVTAESLGGLTYSTTLRLDAAKEWSYQVVGTVGGLRRASELRSLDLAAKLARSALIFERVGASADAQAFRLRQQPLPILEGYRLQLVEAWYQGGSNQRVTAVVTAEDGGSWHLRVDAPAPAEGGQLFVTVTLGNGTRRDFAFPLGARGDSVGSELILTPDLGD